jgi:hypothetical protein
MEHRGDMEFQIDLRRHEHRSIKCSHISFPSEFTGHATRADVQDMNKEANKTDAGQHSISSESHHSGES